MIPDALASIPEEQKVREPQFYCIAYFDGRKKTGHDNASHSYDTRPNQHAAADRTREYYSAGKNISSISFEPIVLIKINPVSPTFLAACNTRAAVIRVYASHSYLNTT